MKIQLATALAFSLLFTSTTLGDGPRLDGEYSYNSYLVRPDDDQLKAVPMPAPPAAPVKVNAYKWAKGELVPSGEGVAVLEFPNGYKLEVSFVLRTINKSTAFVGSGKGLGPISGAEYRLGGLASLDDSGIVTSIAGSVVATKTADAAPDPTKELGGQPLGTVGHFELTQK